MDNIIQPTKRANKKLEIYTAINITPATIKNAAFLHSAFCQLGLPRSQNSNHTFARKCGDVSILIEAGVLWNGTEFVKQILPYGPLPRLIMAWINTYAIKNQTAIIDIGKSPSEFQKMLGKSVTGGKNGTIANFKLQFQALAACSISIGMHINGATSTYQNKPFKSFTAIWPEQTRCLWPQQIVLSDEYFLSLSNKAVPLDNRALSALSDSALSMDVYCWLAGRLHRIKNGIILRWCNLFEQFGQEYTGKNATKNFKKSFEIALHHATAMYPGARARIIPTGILLSKSPPPIPFAK